MSSENAPRFTVVTPCYRAERTVAATVASVAAQTTGDWQHIVVDDGSPDDAAAVVARLAADEPRLTLVRQANAGVCAARNAGWRAARPGSRYVVFLDADDCLEPTFLETLGAFLDAHPDVGMVHSGHHRVGPDDALLPEQYALVHDLHRYAPAGCCGVRVVPPDDPHTTFAALLNVAGVVPSLCLMRASVYAATPGWDEDFGQHHEDTDLFLHMALRAPVRFVPERLVRYRVHPGQNTADPARFGRQEEKLMRKWRDLPGLDPAQRAVVRDALVLRLGRVLPAAGLKSARVALKRGDLAGAARFGLGALRRHALLVAAPDRLLDLLGPAS